MKLKYQNEIFELDKNTDSTYKIIDENFFKVSEGSSFVNCYAAEDEKQIYIYIDGMTYHFEKLDEDEYSETGGGSNADIDEVKPPMPGSVVKILVEVGQKVEEGEALIIVEAMKMETSLFSSIAGIVKEINVSNGEQVGADKILLIVGKE